MITTLHQQSPFFSAFAKEEEKIREAVEISINSSSSKMGASVRGLFSHLKNYDERRLAA